MGVRSDPYSHKSEIYTLHKPSAAGSLQPGLLNFVIIFYNNKNDEIKLLKMHENANSPLLENCLWQGEIQQKLISTTGTQFNEALS